MTIDVQEPSGDNVVINIIMVVVVVVFIIIATLQCI